MNAAENRTRPVEVLAGIVGETIRSPGAKTLIAEIARDLIETWADKGGLRRRVASPARWVVSKVFKPGGNGVGISAHAGRLLTAWARQVNAEHAADPVCHAASRREAFHGFMKNTDFGEFREMVENSRRCFVATLEAFNGQLWKYPAKVGSIMGTLLALVNTGIASVRTFLTPIEKNVGPDLLADLLLSLLRGVDAREVAGLVNSSAEFIRRLHTGNLLLARAGKPLLQVYLTALLKEGLPAVDPTLLTKARIALAEDREALAGALADVLREHPELVLETISSYGSLTNPLLRAFSRRARLFDELDREALAHAVSQGLSDLDTYEIARAVNTLVRVLNGLHDTRPEVFSAFLTSVADSLDTEEIRAAVAWMVPEIADAARPVLDASVPPLKSSLLPAGGES